MGEVLQNLGDMAMRAAHAVGHGGAERLGGEQVRALEVLARARIPHHQIGDEVTTFHESLGDGRLHGERRRSHVAARPGNALGAGEQVALTRVLSVCALAGDQLGHAVRPMVEELTSVERVPRGALLKTMVRTQVDDHGTGVKLRGQRPGRAVGQR